MADSTVRTSSTKCKLDSIDAKLDQLLTCRPVDIELEVIRSELLTSFTGDILQWPSFWTNYQDMVASDSRLSDRRKFRLLYSHLDAQSQALLADIDPRQPDLVLASDRLNGHFSHPTIMKRGIEKSIRTLANVKCPYHKKQWLALVNTAKLVKVLIIGKLDTSLEKYFCTMLTRKLPSRYAKQFFSEQEKAFSDGTKHKDKDWLSALASFLMLTMLRNGVKCSDDVTEELCPLCQLDYHYAHECDIFDTVRLRETFVAEKGLCVRCLAKKDSNSEHECYERCAQCHLKHHLALCPGKIIAK